MSSILRLSLSGEPAAARSVGGGLTEIGGAWARRSSSSHSPRSNCCSCLLVSEGYSGGSRVARAA